MYPPEQAKVAREKRTVVSASASDFLNHGEIYREYKESQNKLVNKLSEAEDISETISQELEQWVRKMRCNGHNEKGIRLEQFREIQLMALDVDVSSDSVSFEPYPDMKMEDYVYAGDRDKINRFHGPGSVQFLDGSTMTGTWEHGWREGHFNIVTTSRKDVDDSMEGKVRILFNDNSWIEGFFKSGILHGSCRYFNAKNRLTFVGMHENGKPIGTCWLIVDGGGCVVGKMNKDGKLSGPDIAYIYPDFRTALVGVFDNGVMVRSQQCNVTNWRTESDCIKVPTFSKPKGSIFRREISTNNFVTLSPTLKDPYETNTIKVRISGLPGASEGIFARSDIQENTILAFYNGIKLGKNYVEEETWEANAYKIFDPSNTPDGALDILEKHRSSTSYCASLAHKTNHSFHPNSQFLVYDHPRWGLVPCLASTCHIDACEEILVGYGYDLDWCPDWYSQAWNTGSHAGVDAKKISLFTLCDLNDKLPDIDII